MYRIISEAEIIGKIFMGKIWGREPLGEGGSLCEGLTWKIVYFDTLFGSTSGSVQAPFLSVKVVSPSVEEGCGGNKHIYNVQHRFRTKW